MHSVVGSHELQGHIRYLANFQDSSIPNPIRSTRASTASKLRSLDCTHLLRPTGGRLGTTHSSNLVAAEARDADVVLALEDELEIADVEGGGAAEFGEATRGGDEIVDKVVCDLEEYLMEVVRTSAIFGMTTKGLSGSE